MNDTQRSYLISELRKIFPSCNVFDAWDDADDEIIYVSVEGRRFAMEIGSDDDEYVFVAEDGKDPLAITIPFQRVDDFVYDRVFTEVQSLPATATEAEIDALCAHKGYRAEVMTDQIDVYRKGRRIAVYMAGA